MRLDLRTILLGAVLTDLVCLFVVLLLWQRSRKRFAGTGFWLLDFACQAVGLSLIELRGHIPDWLSMIPSTALLIGGAILGYVGLQRFVGRRTSQLHNVALLALFAGLQSYLVSSAADQTARNLNLNVFLLAICAQCAWLLLRPATRGLRRATLWVGLVFVGYSLIAAARIAALLALPHAGGGYFESGPFEAATLFGFQLLFVLLTYGLVLMVNERLLEQLGVQEQKFSRAFRSAPYALMLTRLDDGLIAEVNDAFVALSGYSVAETVGNKTVGMHLWANGEDRAAVVGELARSGRVPAREFPFRRRSGEVLTGVFSAEILRLDDQPYVLSSISDITKRKRAEQALAESEERFRALFDHANDGILVADAASKKFVQANPSICSMLGYTQAELLELSVLEIHPPDRLDVVLAAFASHGRCDEFLVNPELPVLRKDGSVFYADISSSVVQLGGREYRLGLFRDVTERRKAQQQKVEAEAMLRQSQKLEAIGTLASGVAHEINNPLNVVMNFGQLILDEPGSTATSREYAAQIVGESERMATIVRALLAFSRQDLQPPAPTAVPGLVATVLSLMNSVLRKDGIAVQTRFADDLPVVTCRGQQIQQVLVNLLTNARDALDARYPDGADDKRITIDVALLEEDGQRWVRTLIEDRGGGISPEVAPRVFDPFYSTKPRHKGTGIGLSISYGIVRDHGGRLGFDSEPGVGTQFYLDLKA